MPRFTDIAKVAISVEIAQGGPIPPSPTASAPFGAAPQPGPSIVGSATAQGGAPTGLTAGAGGAPQAGGALIRSDQRQPQPGMQTSQSLPDTKAPGASQAFTPAKPASQPPPKMPKPGSSTQLLKPQTTAKKASFKLCSVLAPPSPGLISHITGGLGMHPGMFGDGLTGKALGTVDAFGRAKTLFDLPAMAVEGVNQVRSLVGGTPASDALDARKAAAFGVPTEPLPAGAMPAPNPMGSFMDVVAPLKHPIQSVKNFVSGLGNEADRQLTQSMIEQPVEAHQLMYQAHPKTTN